jgi:hypothetical protein
MVLSGHQQTAYGDCIRIAEGKYKRINFGKKKGRKEYKNKGK